MKPGPDSLLSDSAPRTRPGFGRKSKISLRDPIQLPANNVILAGRL
jgi:hypothetical protein